MGQGPLDVELPEDPTHERLLEFLCTTSVDYGLRAFTQRYRAISKKDGLSIFTFHEAELIENLFQPLHHAKSNYMLGNFVGTIALCGLIAEKLAILIHRLNTESNTDRAAFEAMDHVLRVKELKKGKLITQAMVFNFGRIRSAPRRYLHYWTAPASRVAPDAVHAYDAAVRLVTEALGLNDFEDGKPRVNSKLAKSLRVRGAIREQPGGEA